MDKVEAMKILKDFHDKSALFSVRTALETLHPELKESEDEKVREGIIRCVIGNMPDSDIRKKYITWLEKQGEQKPFDTDTIKKKAHQIAWEISKHYDPNACKQEWCEMAAIDMASWIEKQGEQKPTIEMKSAEESLGIDSKTYNEIVNACIFGENKPKFKVKYANSEYNVLEIKEIAGITYYGIEDEPNHIDYVLPDNCEIVSEQKPAWSEEDECYMNECIKAVATKDGWSFEEKRTRKHWLKSLKQKIGG